MRRHEMSDLIERLNATGKWWMIGKGKANPTEPLWGCLIQEPRIDGRALARVEGDSLNEIVDRALAKVSSSSKTNT